MDRLLSIPSALRGPTAFVRSLRGPIQTYIHTEEVGAVILLLAAATALGWANSPWSESYADFWHIHISFDIHIFAISENLGHFVNDGLMAVFFFIVGLEIKRELLHGELSSFRKAIVPVAAAIGGMAAPALLYVAFNGTGEGSAGWGIPMATDIAFALGILALLGKRIPAELRVFLLGLAVVDDLGAIAVIAIFLLGRHQLGRPWPGRCHLRRDRGMRPVRRGFLRFLPGSERRDVAIPPGVRHPRHPGGCRAGGDRSLQADAPAKELRRHRRHPAQGLPGGNGERRRGRGADDCGGDRTAQPRHRGAHGAHRGMWSTPG